MIKNHLCLGSFLKDVLKKEKLSRDFDDCRFKRNSLVYYGNRLDLKTAKETIEKKVYL